MSVIAHHPQVRISPCSRTLGSPANLANGFVDDFQRLLHNRRIVTRRMRSLVDSRERGENEIRISARDLLRHFTADVAIDCEPSSHVSAKMSSGCPRGESDSTSDATLFRQTTANDIESGDARWHHLENRRSCRIVIIVDESHVGSHIAYRVSGEPRGRPRAIVPPKSGKTHRPRVSSHEKRRVGGACY